ncbi:hypothetical protein D3C80_748990 [compost metagenome]
MGCITQQEGTFAAKLLGHPVVHPVSGEPVDLLYLDLQMLHGPLADIFEAQVLRVLGAFVAHRADQSCAATAGQREHGKKVCFVQVHMQLAIKRRTCAVDIGNIEHLLIGAAGKADAQDLAHRRTGAVATGQVVRFTDLFQAIGQP